MAKYIVATVDEIPPGSRKLLELAGRAIGIFNIDGEFFALRNRCPHQGGPLCEGKLSGLIESTRPGEYNYSRKDEIVRCPWHGWEFDLRTGQSWCDPGRLRVRAYEAGATKPGEPVEGPYKATTFPVSSDEEYVFVEV